MRREASRRRTKNNCTGTRESVLFQQLIGKGHWIGEKRKRKNEIRIARNSS